ncbi:vesicle-associated protein 1-1 [Amborella trichopoda]|uniref:vesicle-associated protein 1-1 n=1 Tax=Amborella trichopoda TaxID=13333 RepID=UPI0005D3A69F|nr:vesicle-associated protein 1-1 [Amborella trichopoda]|eukprot:XP_011622139.1 vesicle-associated protein 1-1 [Amborella trichopoda]
MSSWEFLSVQPSELNFQLELKKQTSCTLQLTNKTDRYVAFKVKTTNPKKYCVRPNTGIVLPKSTCDVTVTMQAQRELPHDMQCKDKFLLQSVIANDGATTADITPEMFNKEAGKVVEECKMKVIYIPPPQPPSPVPEGSDEGSSPRASQLDDGNYSSSLFDNAKSESLEFIEKPSESWAVITKLTEEKKSAIQQTQKLQQELGLLRREKDRSAGFSFFIMALVGLLGVLVGYLVKA